MTTSKTPNALIHEKSPYLLQHAHNPVPWLPWGEAAFAKAKADDKPILLSIGYSTCHWCHVMEKESFEDEATAKVMEENLVCIKLDREERPDIDAVYMAAVQALGGQGGWPLNIFLTPDLKPFYGGTYFPPQPRYGRPSWTQVVGAIGQAWRDPTKRLEIFKDSDKLSEALKRMGEPKAGADSMEVAWLEKGFEALKHSFDDEEGGFSPQPKFPMPSLQRFLFRYARRARNLGEDDKAKPSEGMALFTLEKMALGGIYDQLGGGFSRYSVDERWQVPHFEKMLYDNAQLAMNFTEAFQVSNDKFYADVAQGICDYVLRDLAAPEGGFYAAEDADSAPTLDAEKTEGAFYVWTQGEIQNLLGEKATEFCKAFQVRDSGNVGHDPSGELRGQNTLWLAARPSADFAVEKKLLFEARLKRPRPHRDEKIIAAWNGLMISALARAAAPLQRPDYLARAVKAAEFCWQNLVDERAGQLSRRWAAGEVKGRATADDYAALAAAFVDLYERSGQIVWLDRAQILSQLFEKYFFDTETGAVFNAAEGDPSLLTRFQESQDNVEPSAASLQCETWLRLGLIRGDDRLLKLAEKSLLAFATTLERGPRAAGQMLGVLCSLLAAPCHGVISQGTGQVELANALAQAFAPEAVLVWQAKQPWPAFAQGFGPRQGMAQAYVCRALACQRPVTDPAEARQLLVKA